jgi:hypothetical protein
MNINNYRFDKGEYKGQRFIDVLETCPSYTDWIFTLRTDENDPLRFIQVYLEIQKNKRSNKKNVSHRKRIFSYSIENDDNKFSISTKKKDCLIIL